MLIMVIVMIYDDGDGDDNDYDGEEVGASQPPPPLQLSTSFSFAAGKNGFISFQQREDCSSQGIGEIETSQNSLFCSILKVNIVSVFCPYIPS